MVIKTGRIEEVILHVGLHKTGTTSIQNTLFEEVNNKLLEKKDYLYPKSLFSNHSVPIYSAFCDYPEKYHINFKKGYNLAEIKGINERNLVRLKTEITEREQSKLIISGEDISLLSIDNLNALKKYVKSITSNDVMIKVIIYVRNPISWSASSIQQYIKGGATYQNSIKSIKNTLKNLFKNRIDKFVQVFGKNYLNVYSFEEAVAHKYGLVGHFLSKLGFNNNEICKFNIKRANESISLIAGDILSFINEKIPMIKDGKLHEKRSFGDYIPFLYIKGPKFDIPYYVKKELFVNCQEDINWLKENFGINYSQIPQASQINYKFTNEIIMDMKLVYSNPQLSIPLRSLFLEYLQKQQKNQTNANNEIRLKKLLEELGS